MNPPFRYRARLAYVGTGFRGWQRQANAPRTVQAVLEAALEVFAGKPMRALAAGRTDSGVHADGQVVHFDLPKPAEPARLRDAVNAALPCDVRLLDAAPAPGFDARRDALWKEYRYAWSRAPVISPREAPYVAPLSFRAEPSRMAAAIRHLPGTRDFGIFGVQRSATVSGVRTLYEVRIEEDGEELRAVFRGDAFLRGMVRSICGVLADVARGRAEPDRVRTLLEAGDRRLLSAKAPARGLTLVRVEYAEFGVSPEILISPAENRLAKARRMPPDGGLAGSE